MCMCICVQLPAANPPLCPDTVISCRMFVWNVSNFLFCCLWCCFYTMFGDIPMFLPVSFWCHFCDILVPLGVIWWPCALHGPPQGSQGRKVMKQSVCGSFVGSSLGLLLDGKFVTNRKQIVARAALKHIVRRVLQKMFPGTPIKPCVGFPFMLAIPVDPYCPNPSNKYIWAGIMDWNR